MDLKKIKWHYLLNRKQTLLFRSLTHAPHKYYKGLKGMPWQANYVLHFDEGDFFILPEDFEKFRELCKNEGLQFFYDFKKNLIAKIKKLDNVSEKLRKIDPAKLSDKKLLHYIDEYVERALLAHWFLSPFALSDKMLTEKILTLLPGNNESQKQEWLKILTFPEKENEHTKEEKAFYNLAACALNSKNYKALDKKLDHHLKKFGWIGGRYLWEEAWDKKNLEERIDYILRQKKNPIQKYEHLNALRKGSRRAIAYLIQELKIKKSSELYRYIVLAREFSYLRTWRTDIIYRAFYRTQNLFRELGKRVGLKEPDDIRFLTFEEAIRTAKNKKLCIPRSEIFTRKKFYIFVLLKNKAEVLSGTRWEKKMNFLKIKQPEKIIKGSTAFPGKAKGRVKIVETHDDFEKVNTGDILVTTMTFPHFIPVMEKAAAFVTDEGGILCHAAIVSREMGKPCVIGTKHATRVLKDGDWVEVDADMGTVRMMIRI